MLPYALNKVAKHGIRKTRRKCGVRYSITARTIDTFCDFDARILYHRESKEKSTVAF